MADLSEHFYIIGHRGAAGDRLENTLEGFAHAIELGVDAIELDVQEHSSKLWVFHDSRLERLTGASGRFDDHDDPASLRLTNGDAIPTLKQVLDLAWGRVPINIEVKAVKNLGLLLDLLARYQSADATAANGLPWILISSFNRPALMQLRQRACPWPVAPITAGRPLQEEMTPIIEQVSPFSWHFDDDFVDFFLVAELKERGIPCFVYTVNDPGRARELRRRGVSGIFTDFPAAMLKLGDD